MTTLSRRARNIGPLATPDISETLAELHAAGSPVHELCPRSETPGTTDLRRAITRSLNRRFYAGTDGSDYLPCYSPDEIIVSAGARSLQAAAIQALCDPGDEVLLFAPHPSCYPGLVKTAGAEPVVVPSGPQHGFIPSIEDIEAAITPRTRLVFLNSPGDPAGRVWTRHQVAALCELILSSDRVHLLSDEICSELVFGGARHTSPVTHSQAMRERTILISGLSGARPGDGWRVGYGAVADPGLMAAMRNLSVCSAAPPVAGEAATHALEDRSHACAMRIELEHRASRLVRRLDEMGLPALPAEGGFHALADVSSLFGLDVQGRLLESSQDVVLALLADARVASMAGSRFGAPDHIRFSFVRPVDELDAACDAIEAFVLRHRSAGVSAGAVTGVAATPPQSGTPVETTPEPAVSVPATPHQPAA